MTKTLKRRFVVFTMLAVTCLLVFLVLAINSLNWVLQERQTDAILETLMDADGHFPDMEFSQPPPFFLPLDMDRMRASRFFIVWCDDSGRILDINVDQVYSIDWMTAEVYAARALDTGSQSGRMGRFKFSVKPWNGQQMICFVDVTVQIEGFYVVLFASTVIAALCWLVLLVIVFLLSGRVIRPVLVGIEKQKQFITNAGHEMKTPLSIIQSNNDTMALIHGENKYNVHIRNQTKRLNVLMTNLLTLAKLDEEVPLRREAVNISDIALELLPDYQEQALMRELQLHTRIQPELVIRANRDSIRQLLMILLDNAVKYTPDRGTIRITLEREGKIVRFTAENACDPTLEPDPERLFERFYRGDSARTQESAGSGYGIGLSAARAICENLGGTLKAEYPTVETIRFTAKI